MIKPPIFFVSGLPHSGNTLLMNLLGQNPRHYVSPTNALMDLISANRDVWTELPAFQSQGLDVVKPRISSTLKAIIEGFYRPEFAAGKIVFDRSRGWLGQVELMEEVMGEPIHLLVMVRDIRAILADFEKMHRRNPVITPRQQNYTLSQTIEGRAMILLGEQGVLGQAIARLRDALRRNCKSKIMLVRYNNLCKNPLGVLDQIHAQLALAPFKYDPNNVQPITPPDDYFPGMPAFAPRTKVELLDETPWKGILSEDLCERMAREYADIQRFAGSV